MANLSDIHENEKSIQSDIREILENIRELSGAMFIQSQRNYDMLALIGEKLGADVDSMLFKHQQGQVLAPPPSFVFEDEENTQSEE
jgi:hypothetical protein